MSIFHLSRPVRRADLARGPVTVEIVPTEAERASIVRDFGLLGLEAFAASVTLTEIRGGRGVRASGTLAARPVQACVITLSPVVQDMQTAIAVTLLEPDLLPEEESEDGDTLIDLDAEDVEALEGDTVDAGALALEEFALSLDSAPRARGAELPEAARDADGGEEHPFARLAALKRGADPAGGA
ncbi:DUF177 domain-containing protein [Futiania mangrovi]|uniref:DUF177 domain-containing protein n=1 Tax=Futiania mangrovi TaxID=2959716 RepID=A0A9J6PHL7_9PROT|nr:DUF177 domain-containing protein [Futiania mangrovii]MCP1336071.1 hypothetical protein [Futiania mangrovii]